MTLAGGQSSLNNSQGSSFSKVGQTSRSRGQKLWYHVKGLVTSNTRVQYESSTTSGKKVVTKVNVRPDCKAIPTYGLMMTSVRQHFG